MREIDKIKLAELDQLLILLDEQVNKKNHYAVHETKIIINKLYRDENWTPHGEEGFSDIGILAWSFVKNIISK